MKTNALIIISVVLLLTTFQFSKEKAVNNYDYNSLLAIESAKKLYKKKHYEDALLHLLKVASITKNPRIKGEAILEIAFVKFLMGYSSQSYGIFIKKSLGLYKEIELSSYHYKTFKKVFRVIKRNFTPVKVRNQTFRERIITRSKSESQSINEMELNNNLIFKMKKELSKLRESMDQQKEKIEKNDRELLTLRKINNKNDLTIRKLRESISSLNKIKDKDYKTQYKIIKNEKIKIEKEIEEKNKIITQLNTAIEKQELEINQLNETGIVKTKNTDLKKTNVFKTLHQIWEKSL